MRKYFFYLIEDDFYMLFKGDNLKAFLELFYRKEESSYYEKQFNLFVKELDIKRIDNILCEKYNVRKDFYKENNKYSLTNYITSQKETLELGYNYIMVYSDYEISPFINTLSDYFPDLVIIDVNNYKIETIALVSSL